MHSASLYTLALAVGESFTLSDQPSFRSVIALHYEQSHARQLAESISSAVQETGCEYRIQAVPRTLSDAALDSLVQDIRNLPSPALVLGIGGDGTLLALAQAVARTNARLLGVNLGRIGFLADMPANALQSSIGEVLNGRFSALERSLLSCSPVLADGQQEKRRQLALNEIVVHSGVPGRMLDFRLSCDQQPLFTLRADGVIVATPTGSTAYALSAGGPVLHPRVSGLLIIPMLPHATWVSPVVVPQDSKIEVQIQSKHVCLSVDGVQLGHIDPNESLHIQQASERVCMVEMRDDYFYSALKVKLGWGRDRREP